MPDGPYLIKVKLDVTPGPDKAVSDTAEIKVDAMCVAQFVVKAGTDHSPTEVAVAPAVDPSRFYFLLIRPILIGKNPVTPADLADIGEEKKWVLTYSVPVNGDHKKAWDQRKPLRGPHIFAHGQTEWVTDMLGGDKPGSLTKLLFWNGKPEAQPDEMPAAEVEKLKGKGDDEKKLIKVAWAKGRNDITIQIVAGYTPDSYAPAGCPSK